ncbi:MAG: endolytic transglycosylase MltG [Candidatus Peregrinibacteria bacterium]|nr:endolytic transglycosylase MltG [Candidatus Peregrinibacteria bacterium]
MAYTPLYQRKKSVKIQIPTILMGIGGLIVLYMFYSYLGYNHAIKNGYDPSIEKKISFIVHKGDSAKDVGNTLEDKGIIGNGSYFSKYIASQDLDSKIVPGEFDASPSYSIETIAAMLTDGKGIKNTITIPEGLSISQIDDRLAERQLIKPGEFIDTAKKFDNYSAYPFLPREQMSGTDMPLEGFLFPDTYGIDSGSFSSVNLIDLMLKNFQKKLPTNVTQLLAEKNISLFEAVTVASMLEKEARHEGDFPIIAGIMWKRANSGWFLNIDATLLYELHKKTLTRDDLKQDSAYNTYTRKGLPPGPISNPGAKAILAALNPQKTSHWFYITDPKDGKAVYADSNEGQNRNRAIYLK